jgi:hypothetical protein
MSGTAARNKMFEAMSPVTVALLIERRLLDAYPFETTRRGRVVLRSFPQENVYRLALLGDDRDWIVNNLEPGDR